MLVVYVAYKKWESNLQIISGIKTALHQGSNPVSATVISNVGNRGVGNLRLIGLVGLGPASRVFTCSLLL